MIYPPHIPEHLRFAVGQEVFGLVPGLMMYATIWLREHNRVCDVLKREHPEWDDEQLFQTSRLILIGEQEQINKTLSPPPPPKRKTRVLPLLCFDSVMKSENEHDWEHTYRLIVRKINFVLCNRGDYQDCDRRLCAAPEWLPLQTQVRPGAAVQPAVPVSEPHRSRIQHTLSLAPPAA